MRRFALLPALALVWVGCAPQAETPAKELSSRGVTSTTPEAPKPETPAPPAPETGTLTDGAPGATEPKTGDDVAVFDTSDGRIVVKFFPDKAPKTVENFEKLAKKGFYDSTKFHRIVKGFMIQGGDPNTKPGNEKNGAPGTGGPGYTIPAEFNDTPHTRGILSMARSQDPDSAGSQFYIVHEDSNFLDGQYTAFGQVVEGMKTVDKIAETPTKMGEGGADSSPSVPITPVVVKSIKIEKWPVK